MATLRQLEYLVTVVDLGSFTRAAAELHVSQPALSHQIAVLERDVGGALLDRLPRAVRLTPAGRMLLPHARASIAAAGRARAAARQATGMEAGEIHLATVYSATIGFLPNPLRRWRQAHPDIRLRLYEFRHGDEMADAMNNGAADLAVGPLSTRWSGASHSLGEEELVIVMSRDDPLSRSPGPIDLGLLSKRPWVHYAPAHGLAEVLDQACGKAGFSPEVAVRTEQTASAPLLASAGIGPALVPASIIPRNFDGLIFATAPPTRRPLAIYNHSSPDPITTAFSDFIVQEICLMPPEIAELLRPRPEVC
jgi:DNA-binding transcriptional LysR family regulator